jgi:hypothetical protein
VHEELLRPYTPKINVILAHDGIPRGGIRTGGVIRAVVVVEAVLTDGALQMSGFALNRGKIAISYGLASRACDK